MRYIKALIPNWAKDVIRLARAHLLRLATKPKPKGAIKKCQVMTLSDSNTPTFLVITTKHSLASMVEKF